MIRAVYSGREHPYKILVFSGAEVCRMIRLKPKDREPSYDRLTAIFKITYHGKKRI